jgi:hypothetical protein
LSIVTTAPPRSLHDARKRGAPPSIRPPMCFRCIDLRSTWRPASASMRCATTARVCFTGNGAQLAYARSVLRRLPLDPEAARQLAAVPVAGEALVLPAATAVPGADSTGRTIANPAIVSARMMEEFMIVPHKPKARFAGQFSLFAPRNSLQVTRKFPATHRELCRKPLIFGVKAGSLTRRFSRNRRNSL